jgi:hypothetical protein
VNVWRRHAWGMALIGACCLALTMIFPPVPEDGPVPAPVTQGPVVAQVAPVAPAAADMWAPPDGAIDAVKAALPACIAANGAGEVRLMFTLTLGPMGRVRHAISGDEALSGIAQGCVDDALRGAPWPRRPDEMDLIFGFAGGTSSPSP